MTGQRTTGIRVALVIDVREHPQGDRIFLADIDLGDGVPHQVVFGGVRPLSKGDLVAAAPPGARLRDGSKLRSRRFRGERSYGMLCSTDELGWTTGGPDEVALLRLDARPGASLDEVDDPAAWLLDPANF